MGFALSAALALGMATNHLANAATPAEPRYRAILDKYHSSTTEVLRVREDVQRNRLWVLTPDSLFVYDLVRLELIRQTRLPNWSMGGLICPPDLVLNRDGSAFVSSNVEPRLLEVAGNNFATNHHQLEVVSARRWETGFGAMRFETDETLYAMSALGGSLFRLDVSTRSATEIPLSEFVTNACEFISRSSEQPHSTPDGSSLCVRAEGQIRRLNISGKPARGHVSGESCDN